MVRLGHAAMSQCRMFVSVLFFHVVHQAWRSFNTLTPRVLGLCVWLAAEWLLVHLT
jgi:hypothetical protein